jgi:hypothetical protein
MDTHFTFLTSTNPALDEADIKQMRAHVTRKNFEKRRERLEGTTKTRSAAVSNKASRTRRQSESSEKLRILTHTKRPSPDESAQGYIVSPHFKVLTEPNYTAIHQCMLFALNTQGAGLKSVT